MSKHRWEGHDLPPLQLLMVQYLADAGPRNIHEIATGLSKQYKSTWRTFRDLKRDGLVSQVAVKNYLGREYPQFWLTTNGVYEALINGVSSASLLDMSRKIMPDNIMLHCCLELAPYVSSDFFRVGLYTIKSKGKIHEVDTIAMLLADAQAGSTSQRFEEIAHILKKYPMALALLMERTEEMTDLLDQLREIVKENS